MTTQSLDRCIRMRELVTLTGLSRATLNRWVKVGLFPKPIKLGPRAVAWSQISVNAFLRDRAAALNSTDAK